jgi:hypothetical protein
MNKTKKLSLRTQSIRVLSAKDVGRAAGGRIRACCDLDTELLNPFTGGGGGACCDSNTQLLNPFSR